ncbi:MAG TPA: PIG-L family deacetylase, partial [Balneolaceae bacterium]|nr:PIG-L family deacetylase [Balneolaceae bacterium]
MKRLLLPFLLSFFTISSFAQDSLLNYEPKVLLVTAHPDDDALFSATVFKTTKLLGGMVDLALLTNGEGGYTYSTLGNYIYNKELDKEEVGREYLPGIRKQELMAGGEIVGIRNYFFFDQPDFYYTEDVE